jgi:hypothetical protein
MQRILIGAIVILFCVGACNSAKQVHKSDKIAKSKYIEVKVKTKPSDEWKVKQTCTIKSLEGFVPDSAKITYTWYGSRKDKETNGKGFFAVRRIKGRWWIADPEGYLFYNIGVAGVYRGNTDISKQQAADKFETPDKWANFTTKLLRQYGFNASVVWTEVETIEKASYPEVYALSWDFMGDFGRSKNMTVQKSEHLRYSSELMPVFHPEFEKFCNEYAKKLEATRANVLLLGHFSDNELPHPADMLDRSLKLDANNPDLKYGKEAAQEWLKHRKGAEAGLKDITDADRQAFIGYVFETYYKITTSAIRKHDPNHLCLGSRLNSRALGYPEVFRAAGKYLDIVSVNYNTAWTPDPNRMEMWGRESGRPFMITDFHARGMDSGLANNIGSGWIVATQKERGFFYQNFTLSLLECKSCVGWNWFKYRDNNPEDLETDPSNRDSNNGIVNSKYEPYTQLLDEMKKINENVYAIIDYFDSKDAAAN